MPLSDPPDDLLTTTEAARRAGVDRRTILRAIRNGNLPASVSVPTTILASDLRDWQLARELARDLPRQHTQIVSFVCPLDVLEDLDHRAAEEGVSRSRLLLRLILLGLSPSPPGGPGREQPTDASRSSDPPGGATTPLRGR